jgi:prepilin-type N-terminal cleavage/methylation domain-containing protein
MRLHILGPSSDRNDRADCNGAPVIESVLTYSSDEMVPTLTTYRRAFCCSARRGAHLRRSGFTLIEAMTSLAIMSIASSAALVTLSQSMQSTDSSVRSQIALGLAQQLLDEQSTKMYVAVGDSPTNPVLGPTSAEKALQGRQYSAIGSYNGYRSQPPVDPWGIALGTDNGDGRTRDGAFQIGTNVLSRWHQQVDVYYVTDTAPSTPITNGAATYYRMSKVQILYDDPTYGTQVLASLTKVYSYVPSP